MKISKLALLALLGGALMSFGCSDDSSGGGNTGGDPGTGGTGGGEALMCVDSAKTCVNAAIDPTEEACELPAPPADDNCAGDESLDAFAAPDHLFDQGPV